eukprot:1568230-Pleurochrysis_carterae.AAC.2
MPRVFCGADAGKHLLHGRRVIRLRATRGGPGLPVDVVVHNRGLVKRPPANAAASQALQARTAGLNGTC